MKKLSILFAFILFVAFNAQAQEDKYEFIEVVGFQKFMSKKIAITIDAGQEKTWKSDSRMKDADGKVKNFNSMVDALNFMGDRGWKLAQAYIVTAGNQQVYHYLMTRPKTDESE